MKAVKGELMEAAFDYALIEKDENAKLRYCAGEIQKQKDSVASSIMGIGEMLTIAHGQLANYKGGLFTKWVESECGFSKSSAYNYINAFRVFGSCPTVGQLEDGAMYALTSKETPESALKEVLKLAGKGVKISQSKAKAIIKEHKEEQDEADDEKEEEFPEDETIEKVCERETSEIESWARQLSSLLTKAQAAMAEIPTLDELNARTGWERKLKEALSTLRNTKPVACPMCDGDNEKCPCKGRGRITKQQYKQMV